MSNLRIEKIDDPITNLGIIELQMPFQVPILILKSNSISISFKKHLESSFSQKYPIEYQRRPNKHQHKVK